MERHLLFLIIIACYLVFIPGCGFDSTFRAKKDLSMEIRHTPGTPLEVHSRNGSVEIIADSTIDEVAINAVMTCTGGSRDEAEQRLAASRLTAERGTSGRLVIEPIFELSERGGDGAKITVRLPDADGVKVDTSNGNISIKGLSGEAILDTSNGRVTVVDHHGKVHIDTSNGAVQVGGVVGPLQVDTSNSSVEVHDVVGKTSIDTSNGKIIFSLADNVNAPINLDTSNGSIYATISPAFNGTIRMSTSNGRVYVENHAGIPLQENLKKNRGKVTVGDGGSVSVLDTSNGSIKLIIK